MRRQSFGGTAAALAVVVLFGALSGAAATASAAAPDHQMEMKAREQFAAGRYSEALDLFAKLYAETLHPVYLRNIGRCHQKMREPQKAIDAFHDYLAKAKKVSPDERAEIDGYIREMEALREEQARAEKPAPAPVVAAPPPPAAPPVPAAPAPAPDAAPAVTLTQQSAGTTDGEGAFYTRWWFWTAAGVVVAGGVVAALLLSSGGSSRPPCTAMECR